MIEQVLFRLRMWRERPETSLILGFLTAILIGTLLLMLPASTVDGKGADILTALFTSTSATCVTGLIVVDTGSYFTRFGQNIILILIQTGGIGIMTFAALFAWLGRRKISIQSRLSLRDTFLARSESLSLRRMILFILSFTLLFEMIGTALLLFSLPISIPFLNASTIRCFMLFPPFVMPVSHYTGTHLSGSPDRDPYSVFSCY